MPTTELVRGPRLRHAPVHERLNSNSTTMESIKRRETQQLEKYLSQSIYPDILLKIIKKASTNNFHLSYGTL